ncbi:hypothetical protein Tco_1192314 [Tanacetum coccineum]
MGDKHLDTIPETETDEVIKSSVENLVPIPSEFDDFSDNESECDVPVYDESSPIFTTFSNPLFDSNDDFTFSDDESLSNEDVPKENFKIYSNPLFDDEEIISTKIEPHYFNAESNLIESLLNRDTLLDSSPKFDYLLKEFSGELAHINPIPSGIEEADFDLEKEIRLVENLSYDNSSSRPPEELNAEIADTIVESFSPSPILVADSDSLMEEIDLFLASDDSMPPGIEDDDYDSEGDILFLEELLSNDPLPLPKKESSNFDHHDDPPFPRPPLEPPNVEVFFDSEPDTGVVTTKVVKGISEHYILMPNILPTLPTLDPDSDFTPYHDSLGSRNKIFDPGIFIEVQSETLLSRDEFSISFIRDPLSPVFDTLLPFSSKKRGQSFQSWERILDKKTKTSPKTDQTGHENEKSVKANAEDIGFGFWMLDLKACLSLGWFEFDADSRGIRGVSEESEAEEGETTTYITPEQGHNITKEAKDEVKEVMKEDESEVETDWEVEEILKDREEEEEDEDGEYFNSFPTMEELTHHEWILKNP